MRIIARGALKIFWEKNRDAEQPLKAWYAVVKKATWNNPNDVKNSFRSADIVEGNRIIFNIKGNKYRIVVKVQYEFQIIFIRFVGKHSDYDKINITTI